MSKPTWNRTAFDLIDVISQRSDDPHTKIGAVIFDDKNRIVSMGYNGFPVGVIHKDYRLSRDNGVKYNFMVHAEQNAINFAERSRLAGSVLFVSIMPCARCAQDIIQTGIKKVVIDAKRQEQYENIVASRYFSDLTDVLEMFNESRVGIDKFYR